MNDLVSVIIPVYNVEKYLSQCIESVLNQTYKNIEILLIDDGATDSSPAICDKYAEKDKRIKVIHKENGGVSHSRNIGIEKATGQWIVFVDGDDIIHPQYVEFLLLSVKENGSDISYCNYEDFEHIDEIKNKPLFKFEEVKQECYESLYVMQNAFSLWLIPNVWGKIIRTELFQNVRFDVGVVRAEDLDVVYRLVAVATKVSNIKHTNLYYYRKREGSSMYNTTVKALEDFDMRIKAYNLFATLEGCERTMNSMAKQTMRIFLDFSLLGKNNIKDYKLFRKNLQKYGRLLYKKMWIHHTSKPSERFEINLIRFSVKLWTTYRLLQYKFFGKPLYVQ